MSKCIWCDSCNRIKNNKIGWHTVLLDDCIHLDVCDDCYEDVKKLLKVK